MTKLNIDRPDVFMFHDENKTNTVIMDMENGQYCQMYDSGKKVFGLVADQLTALLDLIDEGVVENWQEITEVH